MHRLRRREWESSLTVHSTFKNWKIEAKFHVFSSLLLGLREELYAHEIYLQTFSARACRKPRLGKYVLRFPKRPNKYWTKNCTKFTKCNWVQAALSPAWTQDKGFLSLGRILTDIQPRQIGELKYILELWVVFFKGLLFYQCSKSS